MIVAVISVRVVQVVTDEVIDVIPVRNALVPAADPMPVRLVMGAASVGRRAAGRVRTTNHHCVLLDPVALRDHPDRDLGSARFAQALSHLRHRLERRVDVALHLDQGDRWYRE